MSESWSPGVLPEFGRDGGPPHQWPTIVANLRRQHRRIDDVPGDPRTPALRGHPTQIVKACLFCKVLSAGRDDGPAHRHTLQYCWPYGVLSLHSERKHDRAGRFTQSGFLRIWVGLRTIQGDIAQFRVRRAHIGVRSAKLSLRSARSRRNSRNFRLNLASIRLVSAKLG